MTTLNHVWYGTVIRTGALGEEPCDLGMHPLLRGLDPPFVEALSRNWRGATYDTEQHLFRRGQPVDRFFFVFLGFVALEHGASGPTRTRLGTIGPGDALGRARERPTVEWPFDGWALEPTTVAMLDARAVGAAVDEWPTAGTRFLRRLVAWPGGPAGSGGVLLSRIPGASELEDDTGASRFPTGGRGGYHERARR